VVGVLINHDLIGVPEPVTTEAVVVWCDAKVKAPEPKTRRAPACKMPDVVRAEPARKVSVLPRMIEMVVRIIPAGVMPNPLTARVDVGGVWVPRLVTKIALFLRRVWLPPKGSRAMGGRRVCDATTMFAFTAPLSKSRKRKHQQRYQKSDVFFHPHLQYSPG